MPATSLDLGAYFRLYRDMNQPATEVLISSHGGYVPWSVKARVPSGTALVFYTEHGWTLDAESVDRFWRDPPEPHQTVYGGESCTNYVLRKFKDTVQTGEEGSTSYYLGRVNANRSWIQQFPNAPRMDIIAPRNRPGRNFATLNGLFDELRKKGIRYEQIHCSFCRELFAPGVKSESMPLKRRDPRKL